MTVRLLSRDCREIMATLPENSVDAIVTDPPYGLEFMGKEWDKLATPKPGNIGGFADGNKPSFERVKKHLPAMQSWHESWAREAYRVLKPGGHLLAFGGSRTYHRLACAVEDAGFEVRDQLQWLYGSGFPKSKNLCDCAAKGRTSVPGPVDEHGWITCLGGCNGWIGIGTALKPAHEPIVLARKPLIGTVAANVATHGTGALNIDGCRIETTDSLGGGDQNGKTKTKVEGWDRPWMHDAEAKAAHAERVNSNVKHAESLGRWPANVVLDADAAAMLDGIVAPSVSRSGRPRKSAQPGNGYGMTHTGAEYDDTGGPSRFFYCAKASRSERNAGLAGMPERTPHPDEPNGRAWDIPGSHSTPRANHHPTVKPIALMRWLCRLITPPGGTVLDPFTGSGTTGVACVQEGFAFIGIEQDAEYCEIARRRIAHARAARRTGGGVDCAVAGARAGVSAGGR